MEFYIYEMIKKVMEFIKDSSNEDEDDYIEYSDEDEITY